MVYLLYDILLLCAALVLAPYYLWRGFRYGKSRRGIRERLGRYGRGRLEEIGGRPVIWVHAVSVGETRAVLPLLNRLKKEYPGYALVLTNVTETGREVASRLECVDLCLFFPFDLSWVVRRVLRKLQPKLVVLVETELWPNLVRQTSRAGIPLALVNGRISDRSFPRYRKIRRVLRPLLHRIDLCAMQTELDAERIRELGAPREHVRVTGNLKFDMPVPALSTEDRSAFRSLLGIDPGRRVLVAGSTHQGEEEVVLRAFQKVRDVVSDAQLILVPRHPERAGDVAEQVKAAGFEAVLRSQCPRRPVDADTVVVGDTLGEMLRFYSLADVVFVGGSLVPVGGHNILEASLLAKPVLFGPHMNNFKEIEQLVLFAAGGRKVSSMDELAASFVELLQDEPLRLRMGRAGQALIERHAGATERTLGSLKVWLETSGAA